MPLLIIIVLVIVFVIIAKNSNKKHDEHEISQKKTNSINEDDKPKEDDILKGKVYRSKSCLLTSSELKFYEMLKNSFPDTNIQVQQVLYSFIEQEREYFNQRPTGLYKSVDFLMCDDELKPLVALELNDKSHTSLDRQQRDKFVYTLLETCAIPHVVFTTSEELNEEIIRKRINDALKK